MGLKIMLAIWASLNTLDDLSKLVHVMELVFAMAKGAGGDSCSVCDQVIQAQRPGARASADFDARVSCLRPGGAKQLAPGLRGARCSPLLLGLPPRALVPEHVQPGQGARRQLVELPVQHPAQRGQPASFRDGPGGGRWWHDGRGRVGGGGGLWRAAQVCPAPLVTARGGPCTPPYRQSDAPLSSLQVHRGGVLRGARRRGLDGRHE